MKFVYGSRDVHDILLFENLSWDDVLLLYIFRNTPELNVIKSPLLIEKDQSKLYCGIVIAKSPKWSVLNSMVGTQSPVCTFVIVSGDRVAVLFSE